jgi:hypothetical protein
MNVESTIRIGAGTIATFQLANLQLDTLQLATFQLATFQLATMTTRHHYVLPPYNSPTLNFANIKFRHPFHFATITSRHYYISSQSHFASTDFKAR